MDPGVRSSREGWGGDEASDPQPRSQASETPSSCQDTDRAHRPPVLASVPNLGPGPGAAPGQRRGRGDTAGPRGGGAEPLGHRPQVLTHGLRRRWADKGSSLGLPEPQGRSTGQRWPGGRWSTWPRGSPPTPCACWAPRRSWMSTGEQGAPCAAGSSGAGGERVLRPHEGSGSSFRLQPLWPLPGRCWRAKIQVALGFSWAQGSGSSPQTSGASPGPHHKGNIVGQAGPHPCTLEAVELRKGP